MASWSKADEDDYMSDKVLSKCHDKRPGLIPAHVARKYRKEEKIKTLNKLNRTKPIRVLEAEKREEGMSSSLDSSNKGFAMLQRMGYKPGMGLGNSGSGISEPIAFNLRVGRSGLGHDTETTRKRNVNMAFQKTQAVKRQKAAEKNTQKFLIKQSVQFFDKLATQDLHKSQRVCEQLDSQKGLTEAPETFFWPKNLLPIQEEKDTTKRSKVFDLDGDDDEPWKKNEDQPEASDEDEEEEEKQEEEEVEDLLTPGEQLAILTMYLRNTHLYCVWCGTTFSDRQDMTDNCPGNTADVHD